MAQWRAVPTAVWTAVGALAFLAAAGVAVVLGAGLHVWSGPASPGAVPAISGAHPGGSGVVTVPPRTTTAPGSPRSAGPATTPVAALPFVPFLPPTSSPAGQPVTAPVVVPPASGRVAHPHGRALGLLRNARELALVDLRELRSPSGVQGLRSGVGRFDTGSDGERADAVRHFRHGLGKGHAAAHHGRHHVRAHQGHRHFFQHRHGHARSHGKKHDKNGKHSSQARVRPYPGHARHYDD